MENQEQLPSYNEMMIWINALRSGKYDQTIEKLQDQNGFCCLGVACDLFIPEDLKKYYPSNSQFSDYLYGGLPSDQKNAPQWLKDIGEKKFYSASFSNEIDLPTMNDNMEFTFADIADILEHYYITSGLLK